MPEHGSARPGWHDHRALGFFKYLNGMHGDRARLVAHPGVEGRLPAASLAGGEFYRDAGALQDFDHRLADLRVQGIDDAGDEKLDGWTHGFNCILYPAIPQKMQISLLSKIAPGMW